MALRLHLTGVRCERQSKSGPPRERKNRPPQFRPRRPIADEGFTLIIRGHANFFDILPSFFASLARNIASTSEPWKHRPYRLYEAPCLSGCLWQLGFRTRYASLNTRSLSGDRLMTQFEMMTSTIPSAIGKFSIRPSGIRHSGSRLSGHFCFCKFSLGKTTPESLSSRHNKLEYRFRLSNLEKAERTA